MNCTFLTAFSETSVGAGGQGALNPLPQREREKSAIRVCKRGAHWTVGWEWGWSRPLEPQSQVRRSPRGSAESPPVVSTLLGARSPAHSLSCVSFLAHFPVYQKQNFRIQDHPPDSPFKWGDSSDTPG